MIEQFTRIPPPRLRKSSTISRSESGTFSLDRPRPLERRDRRELYISETTVKTHVTHILQKLNLRDRVQAVVLAYQTGLFETDGRSPNRDERAAH